MMPIKKIVVASTFALTMTGGFAGIAQAQPDRYYDHRFDRQVDRLSTGYVDRLNLRINDAAREGRISWRQARDLQDQLNQVKPLAYRYQTGQARQWEVNRLERTVDRVREVIRD
jgi:hypothetical protein